MSRVNTLAAGIGLAALLSSAAAFAADPESCKTVRFADVGWTDITATTATASVILEALGYAPEVQVLSVPDLHFAVEQGHRRLPGQLDADHGGRPETVSGRQDG